MYSSMRDGRPMSIEDPLKVIPNKFELIHAAAKRAYQLSYGAKPRVAVDGHSFAVSALMEIAAGHTDFDEENSEANQG